MKIIFLCNEYPPHPTLGGIGMFTHTIAHGLVDDEHKVTVLGYGSENGERYDNGVRVVTLPESTTKKVAWLINRRRLYSWLKTHALAGAIDIIETPEYQGMLPFKFPWCPVVVRLHNSNTLIDRHNGIRPRIGIRLCERRLLKCSREWISVSDFILRLTESEFELSPKRWATIYNPVKPPPRDTRVLCSLPADFVLYVGTVREEKGAYVLAEAARTFLVSFPDIHLVYAGTIIEENGQPSEQTIRQILGERFGTRVHFLGLVEHDIVLACMKRATLFAFPSKFEAFSLVPLEAMSCGVPVVYSTSHSGPEAIDDGVTGLLADPYSVHDVAEKILRLLNDAALSGQLAENAKETVKDRFSLQRCVDETIAFYRTCLE